MCSRRYKANFFEANTARSSFFSYFSCPKLFTKASGISRFTAPSPRFLDPSAPKGNSIFEILLVKFLSLEQKTNQILPATTEKAALCSFRL